MLGGMLGWWVCFRGGSFSPDPPPPRVSVCLPNEGCGRDQLRMTKPFASALRGFRLVLAAFDFAVFVIALVVFSCNQLCVFKLRPRSMFVPPLRF